MIFVPGPGHGFYCPTMPEGTEEDVETQMKILAKSNRFAAAAGLMLLSGPIFATVAIR